MISVLHDLHLTANPDGVMSRECQLSLIVHFDGLVPRLARVILDERFKGANLSEYFVGPTCYCIHIISPDGESSARTSIVSETLD
jgi:hypothetical protein